MTSKPERDAIAPPLYGFIGPDRLLPLATAETPRLRLRRGMRAREILTALERPDARADELIATYVVDGGGAVWIAERQVEHIAAARGAPVLAAGEMTLDLAGDEIVVLAATNQSTGYCPSPASWTALAVALDAIGVDRPDDFEQVFEFGRCAECGALAIVKDGERICAECGGALAALHRA